MGAYAADLAVRSSVRKTVFVFSLMFGGLILAAGVYGLLEPQKVLEQLPDGETVTQILFVLVGIGLITVVLNLVIGRRSPFAGLSLSLAVLWLGLSLLIAPAIDEMRSGRALMRAAESSLDAGQELGLVGWPEQFLLQAERPVQHFGFRRDPDNDLADAIAWLGTSANRRVLVSAGLARECVGDRSRIELGIAHRRDWWLIDSGSVSEACRSQSMRQPGTLYLYTRSAVMR